MIAIIIQARTGSTRFKEKVIKKIYKDKNILDFIIENLKILNQKIIIATTNQKKDDRIVSIAKEHSLDYYRGDENNVLDRYIKTAIKYNVSKIIRVTSDNVFIQPDLIKPLLRIRDDQIDYSTYHIGNKNVVLTHWGLFSEYVKLGTLQKIQNLTSKLKYLEHVTYYIYTHPEEFNIKYLEVPKKLNRKDIRLTIDTKEDFERSRIIINYLMENNLEWNFQEILNFILKQPKIIENMKETIESQEK